VGGLWARSTLSRFDDDAERFFRPPGAAAAMLSTLAGLSTATLSPLAAAFSAVGRAIMVGVTAGEVVNTPAIPTAAMTSTFPQSTATDATGAGRHLVACDLDRLAALGMRPEIDPREPDMGGHGGDVMLQRIDVEQLIGRAQKRPRARNTDKPRIRAMPLD